MPEMYWGPADTKCGDYAVAYATEGTVSKIAMQKSDCDNIKIYGDVIS